MEDLAWLLLKLVLGTLGVIAFGIVFGLFFKGIDRKLAAHMQGRIGPPIRQPFRDVVKLYTYEEIRFFLLSAQYRSPVNFSDKLMDQSRNGLARIYESLKNLAHIKGTVELQDDEKQLLTNIKNFKANFISHMDDDLNTADAIADIFDMVKEINTALSKEILVTSEAAGTASTIIRELGDVLGILQSDIDVEITPEIQELIDKRIEARKAKDFAASDKLRDMLKDLGILIEDTKDGYKVKYL